MEGRVRTRTYVTVLVGRSAAEAVPVLSTAEPRVVRAVMAALVRSVPVSQERDGNVGDEPGAALLKNRDT